MELLFTTNVAHDDSIELRAHTLNAFVSFSDITPYVRSNFVFT